MWVIDVFGDNIARSHMRGDGWRTRHDSFKWSVVDVADWCNYRLIPEPSSLFLPYIKQKTNFLSNKHSKRQGMIPDMLDVKRNVLLDVKGFSWGTYYRPIRFRNAKTCAAAALRADQVHRSYVKKAIQLDRDYNDWKGPCPGPVENRLRQFGRVEGLAVGAHGEGSKDLIHLLERIAARGAARRFRELGFDSPLQALSTVKKHVFMTVGVEAMRGMARLRITNLSTILAGPESSKACVTRRTNVRSRHRDHKDCYWAAHCHFDF